MGAENSVAFPYTAQEAIPEFTIVKLGNADKACEIATDGTTAQLGVTLTSVHSGKGVAVAQVGKCFVRAGGSIARGTWVRAGSGGKATAAGAGTFAIGYIIEAATADGHVVEMIIAPRQVPA